MITAIVCLIFLSVIVLLGYGKRALSLLRIRPSVMLGLILVMAICAVIPSFVGDNYAINYLGVGLTLVALLVFWNKITWRRVVMTLVGTGGIVGIILLYRYFAQELFASTYGEVVYVLLIALSAYVVSWKSVNIFINTVFAVGVSNLIVGLVPIFGGLGVIIGGNGEVMLLALTIAITLGEVIFSLANMVKMRKNNSLKYEASSDNFDDIDSEY